MKFLDDYQAFVDLYENANPTKKNIESESKKKELIREATEMQSSNNTLSPKSATSMNVPYSVSDNHGLKRPYQQNKTEQNEDEENLGPGQRAKRL